MEKSKQEGNQHFVQKRFFDALDLYNQGIKNVSVEITDHLKGKAKELLNQHRPSSALFCAVALLRLRPADVDALLLYAKCLSRFDGLIEGALLVCLQALVDGGDDQKARDALAKYGDIRAKRNRSPAKAKDKAKTSENAGTDGKSDTNTNVETDETTATTTTSTNVKTDATVKTTTSTYVKAETTRNADSDDSIINGVASSESNDAMNPPNGDPEMTSIPTTTATSTATSSTTPTPTTTDATEPAADPASLLSRVWTTAIPLEDCFEDLSSVSSSLPESEKEGSIAGTILSNAAACELALRQPHLAAASAAAALLFPTNQNIKAKAAFRLCTALIQSCSFALAAEAISLAATFGVDAKELTRLRETAELRLAESRDGSYDWERHLRWTKENPGQDLDCAPFLGPVEIAEIPLKGCGLRAARDIRAGELLIVDHAYFACHRSNITHLMKGIFERVAGSRLDQFERSKTLFFLTDGVNPRDLRPSSPTHVLSFPRFPLPLLPQQLLQLQHSAALDDLLRSATEEAGAVEDSLELLRGEMRKGLPMNPSSFKTTEEKLQFGEKLVGIVNTNMMHHAQACCPWHVLESQEDTALSRYATDGLWILPSFLNTGSSTNVVAMCIGDVLVCRAARHVKKGDELLINYTIEREWSKREDFMEHHGIPMPPDPDSPLKGKTDQLKKIESKLNEISNMLRQNRYAEALKALNSLEKKNKNVISLDLTSADILFKKAKCRSMMGDSPSQVLPILLSALEAERAFRPYGSDYITLVLQWMRFPNLKTDEKTNLKNLLEDLSMFTYGLPFDRIAALLDNSWN